MAYRNGNAEYPPSVGSQLGLEELDELELVELELARKAESPALAGWIGVLNALSTPPESPPPSAGQLLGLLEELLVVLEDDA